MSWSKQGGVPVLALVAVLAAASREARGGPAVVKPPLRGLIDMQNIAWHNADGGQPTFVIGNVRQFPGVFGGIVINATWSAVQPLAAGPLDFSTIDDALAQVRAYNAENPRAPLGVKLRVYAGNAAPDWAKAIDGGPVTLFRNPAGCQSPPCPITVGKYWTPDFIAAWRAFQARLAARYDAEPIIRQVAVTSCAPQTDEPFVPSVDTDARANLTRAGYSDAAEEACLRGAFDDYAAWATTAVDYPFNVFGKLGGGNDPAVSIAIMDQCRAALGERCVLANHALSAPLRTVDAAIYHEIETLGPPINFQTESPQAMGCLWIATVAQGVALGAAAIEVWPDARFQGFTSLAQGDVARLAGLFTSPIPVPDTPPLPTPCSGLH